MRTVLLFFASTVSFAQSPLDVTSGLQGMVDRHLTEIAKKLLETRSARVAQIRTPAAVKERQDYIRRTLIEEIGGFPEKTPLNARITSTLRGDGYTVEKLIFESQPGYFVTANVFVPAAGRRPYPAVLGTAGHSLDGKAEALYQRVWISLAKRGFLVLAYDPPGQGERLEYLDPATGKSRLPEAAPASTAWRRRSACSPAPTLHAGSSGTASGPSTTSKRDRMWTRNASRSQVIREAVRNRPTWPLSSRDWLRLRHRATSRHGKNCGMAPARRTENRCSPTFSRTAWTSRIS